MGVALKLAFYVSLFSAILAYLLLLQDCAVCFPAHPSFISLLFFFYLLVSFKARAAISLTDVYIHQLKGRYSNWKPFLWCRQETVMRIYCSSTGYFKPPKNHGNACKTEAMICSYSTNDTISVVKPLCFEQWMSFSSKYGFVVNFNQPGGAFGVISNNSSRSDVLRHPQRVNHMGEDCGEKEDRIEDNIG